MFGYGFGISDVRVTLADEREEDCLQKIYPIGRHFAAGFAGSVKIGFAMLDELRRLSTYNDERVACDPHAVLREWPACARTFFCQFEEAERMGGCHLMLVMVHPQEHVGNPAWPRSFVHIFKSPSFEGETVPVHTLGSIGSGVPTRNAETQSNRLVPIVAESSFTCRARWGAKVAWPLC
jgi:hypothetical protein